MFKIVSRRWPSTSRNCLVVSQRLSGWSRSVSSLQQKQARTNGGSRYQSSSNKKAKSAKSSVGMSGVSMEMEFELISHVNSVTTAADLDKLHGAKLCQAETISHTFIQYLIKQAVRLQAEETLSYWQEKAVELSLVDEELFEELAGDMNDKFSIDSGNPRVDKNKRGNEYKDLMATEEENDKSLAARLKAFESAEKLFDATMQRCSITGRRTRPKAFKAMIELCNGLGLFGKSTEYIDKMMAHLFDGDETRLKSVRIWLCVMDAYIGLDDDNKVIETYKTLKRIDGGNLPVIVTPYYLQHVMESCGRRCQAVRSDSDIRYLTKVTTGNDTEEAVECVENLEVDETNDKQFEKNLKEMEQFAEAVECAEKVLQDWLKMALARSEKGTLQGSPLCGLEYNSHADVSSKVESPQKTTFVFRNWYAHDMFSGMLTVYSHCGDIRRGVELLQWLLALEKGDVAHFFVTAVNGWKLFYPTLKCFSQSRKTMRKLDGACNEMTSYMHVGRDAGHVFQLDGVDVTADMVRDVVERYRNCMGLYAVDGGNGQVANYWPVCEAILGEMKRLEISLSGKIFACLFRMCGNNCLVSESCRMDLCAALWKEYKSQAAKFRSKHDELVFEMVLLCGLEYADEMESEDEVARGERKEQWIQWCKQEMSESGLHLNRRMIGKIRHSTGLSGARNRRKDADESDDDEVVTEPNEGRERKVSSGKARKKGNNAGHDLLWDESELL